MTEKLVKTEGCTAWGFDYNINDIDPSKLRRRHYKHTQRWEIANTLTSLYGYDKALELMW